MKRVWFGAGVEKVHDGTIMEEIVNRGNSRERREKGEGGRGREKKQLCVALLHVCVGKIATKSR